MASSLPIKKDSKFRIENNVFISATEEINAHDLQTYLFELVLSGFLPFGTTFYMIGGIHHGITQDKEAFEGQTDFTLLHGFYHQVYTKLCQLEIWNKMEYDFSLVPITCSEEVNKKTWQISYQFSEISKRELTKLARKLTKGKKPSLVVFASCFSFYSTIKDYLYSKGVMASLSISFDKGKVTEGKLFSLDQDQQDVIKRYDEVMLLLHFHHSDESNLNSNFYVDSDKWRSKDCCLVRF